MSDAADDDKQFEPTPKKLEEARKKGEVPRSADLTTAAAYAGLIAVAAGVGGPALRDLGMLLMILLDQADGLARNGFSENPTPWMGGILGQAALLVAPFLLVPAVFVILATIAQRAFLITPSKLMPKGNRISPLQGIKNKFGRNGLFEFAKSFAKLVIFSLLLGLFLWGRFDDVVETMLLSPGVASAALLRMILTLLLLVFVIAFTIGAIDFLWQRAEHLRKNRMSRKEMMDELKNAEGDPLMKNQRRQKAIDFAMNRMMADVPTASVVVVNPTHYAVALRWTPGQDAAPVCVAKGVDEVAARIRSLAAEHGVPLHSDPPTARALHAGTDIGQEIAPEHYKAVAAAIRFAQSLREKARHRA